MLRDFSTRQGRDEIAQHLRLAAFEAGIPAIPQSLKDLFAAADKARQAFHAHRYEGLPDDLDAKLAHDLEDRKLLDASSKARIAYEKARDEYLSQEAA